jgi:hypothetical protein
MPTYDELSIRIQPLEGDRYQVVASGPDGATASGAFALPFSETELDNFVLRVGRQRMAVRGYRSAHMEEARRFGSELFEALMVDGVRDVFRASRGAAESGQRGLRVTLYLTDVPKLMAIPWEFLYERPRFLAQSIYTPVVRSLDLGEVRSPQPVTLPLNVLGMVSQPRGFDALAIDNEKEKLSRALAPLLERGLVTLEWLERGTLRQLDEAIGRRGEVHIFHYVGHGAYDARADGGFLVLENDRGEPHEVSGEELGSLLQDERGLRLAVLNSCEGARSSHVDPFSGVASSLVHYGIPAVIGMQFEITDEAAIAFAGRLYTSLAQGYPVDAAVAQSRRSIFAAGSDIQFGTPVLFLRGADARLFDLENPAAAELEREIGFEKESSAEAAPAEAPIAPAEDPVAPPEEPVGPVQPSEPWEPSVHLALRPAEFLGWLISGALFRLLGERLRYRAQHPKKHRISTRRLVIWSLALLMIGAIVTAAGGGSESESGTAKAGLVIATVSFLGLWWVGFRLSFSWLARIYGRFFS